jgi:Cysteine-rich secretory protein family
MGTRGAFSPEQMVGNWIAEKAYYRQGQFPYVSRTDNWVDVAHYTQVVWRGTTHVGCAIYPTRNWDYLICRYSPPGNVDGRRAV